MYQEWINIDGLALLVTRGTARHPSRDLLSPGSSRKVGGGSDLSQLPALCGQPRNAVGSCGSKSPSGGIPHVARPLPGAPVLEMGRGSMVPLEGTGGGGKLPLSRQPRCGAGVGVNLRTGAEPSSELQEALVMEGLLGSSSGEPVNFHFGLACRGRHCHYCSMTGFRERLWSKRVSYDSDMVVQEALIRLGPEDDGSVLPELDCLILPPEDLKEREAEAPGPVTSTNPWAVLTDFGECERSARLMGKAKALVRFYSRYLTAENELPPTIECGGLRRAVRQVFPAQLDTEWELSFKTCQKVEKNCCMSCKPKFMERINDWSRERYNPVEVDPDHLRRFRRALACNVEMGWDNYRSPFIPNGHATLWSPRADGGNWNVEEFSEVCDPTLVFSAGKPRVVTLFSAYNTSVLAPLHYSLYHCLERMGWLLVGDPTDRHIGSLNGHQFVSVDYESATDNIKTEYVRAAIDVLIEKARLTEDEERVLRVLGELRLPSDPRVCTRGQPMGSVMSFPLLCLINKTVVDLALVDLLESGKISFSEFVQHRCLINGDDLLFREPGRNMGMRDAVIRHGNAVGLVLNREKSLVSVTEAEVNSRLFRDGCYVKKLNASALWMDPDVEDVLGFAHQASIDVRSFRKIVKANLHILRKQKDKFVYNLPASLQRVVRQNRAIRAAVTSVPVAVRPIECGAMTVGPRPDGYYLSPSEEYHCIVEEVERVRPIGIRLGSRRREKFRTSFVPNAQSFSSTRKRPVQREEELILTCLSRRFLDLEREKLCVGWDLDTPVDLLEFSHKNSVAEGIVDYIHARKGSLVRPQEMKEIWQQMEFIGLD